MNEIKDTIGYADYSWNPITGCLNGCEYCYARKLANGRLRSRYLESGPCEYMSTEAEYDPFYPRFWPERMDDFEKPNRYGYARLVKPKRIFVCDMGELFGDWIPTEWQEQIFDVIKRYQGYTFLLLTKQPQNLPKWSPFPDNCEVGVSVTQNNQLSNAFKYLSQIEATVKFISFEPLLEKEATDGQQT